MAAMTKEQKALQRAMSPTVIDRVIGYFNPVAGYQRQQARTMSAIAGTYTGASRQSSWSRSWFASSGDANTDLMADLPTLRQRCRDLVRNNPVAGGAIASVTTNVVGSGLTIQSTIDAEFLGMSDEETDDWQRTTEREFRLWAEGKHCDLTRVQTFGGLQELAFRSALENGDSFAVLPEKSVQGSPYKLRVQIIEADQVCNPSRKPDSKTLVGGIETDTDGAPVKLHVMTEHPGSSVAKTGKWAEVTFYGANTGRCNVIHLFDRRRPGQLRGVPYLAAVIEPLKQISRYTEAELMAAVVSGLFTVFVKSEAGQGGLLGPQDLEAGAASGSQNRDYALGNGMIIEGLPGDSIETINPGRPNDSFDPFVQAILKQVGVSLELPYEVLMKAYLSSYSAARAALLDAWRFFRKRRRWLATNFCQPIYETWLAEAVASGRIYAPGFFADPAIKAAYCRATWHGDGPGAIDPNKEVQAAEKRMDINLTNLAQEKAAYDGGDWETTVRQRKKELDVIGSQQNTEGTSKAAQLVPEPFDPDNPQ
jgi:lambda family phage portal protein